jgi:hypothetical protein
MNIWSLFKHRSIKLLLFKAQQQLGMKHFCIEEEDDKDFFAIALVKQDQPEVRAYVYTYGQSREMYGIHLEYPWFIENAFNDVIQVYEDLSLNQIVNTLATHFDVARYDMAG